MKETDGIVTGYLANMTPQLIVRTINLPLVPLSELLYGCFDVHHTALLPHRLGGVVAVGPGPIPVSINGLGVKRDHDTNDMKVLSDTLGDKEFMFGAEPSFLDLTLFSVLAQLTTVEESVVCPLRDHMTEHHTNLVGLVARMKDRAWAEHWDLATGETLDLNPHIPKPEPEEKKEEEETEANPEEEEKKDEEKKEETEKKEEKKEDEEEKKEEKKD